MDKTITKEEPIYAFDRITTKRLNGIEGGKHGKERKQRKGK